MRTEKSRSKGREILAVSLPIDVFEKFDTLCKTRSISRSKLITKIIEQFLKDLGMIDNGK